MRFIGVILFCILSFNSIGQTLDNDTVWDLFLNDVKVKYRLSLKYQAMLPKAKFGDKLEEINGKEIAIEGFYLPGDMTGYIFVLSRAPSSMCFFCSGAGIETIVEMNIKKDEMDKFRKLKTDDYIAIKGKLRLNNTDEEHLIYIVDDVEFVRKIK